MSGLSQVCPNFTISEESAPRGSANSLGHPGSAMRWEHRWNGVIVYALACLCYGGNV